MSRMFSGEAYLVYEYVREYIAAHGYAPKQIEIADYLEMSRASVEECLHGLARRGYLKRRPNKHRGIELVKEFSDGQD